MKAGSVMATVMMVHGVYTSTVMSLTVMQVTVTAVMLSQKVALTV